MTMIRTLLFILFVPISFTYLSGQNEAFKGGNGTGYSYDLVLNSANNILSLGGNGDGFSSKQIINNQSTLSHGGFGDGYSKDDVINSNSIVSFGGNGDGYSANFFIRTYWTGNSSTAWNTGSNWSSNTKPLNADHVIIPSGRTNYPLLGNSLLSIGDAVILTGFRCASLWVETGGEFSGKVGTTLANWSELNIQGQFTWLNPSPGSFENKPGGKIFVKNGGLLEVK